MMKKLFLIVAALLLAGCVTPIAGFKTVTFEGREFDEVWDATVAAVSEVFPVETADSEKGSIYTGYYVQSREASPARIPEVILSVYKVPDNLYNLRWKLEAKVYPSENGTDVSLKVQKEREDTVAVSSMSLRDADAPQAPTRPELETSETGYTRHWTSLGSDKELEEKLLEKIRARLSGK